MVEKDELLCWMMMMMMVMFDTRQKCLAFVSQHDQLNLRSFTDDARKRALGEARRASVVKKERKNETIEVLLS